MLGLGVLALPALCSPISLNTWYQFDWTGHQNDVATAGTGTPFAGTLNAPAAPWTFTGTGTFVLTDIGLNQQQFALYDNGIFQALSTFPVAQGSTNCGANPAVCLTTPFMSTLSFVLGGNSSTTHSLTILTQADFSTAGTTNVGSGTAYFNINGVACTVDCGPPPPPPPGVPEPATMGLMGLGLGLGGLLFRKRNRS